MSKNTNLSFLTDYITADITNGRIGINNASPAYAFDVTGVAKFSSSVTAADLIISDTYANDPLIKLATTTSGSVEVQMRTATTTYNAGIGVVTSGYDFGLFTNNTTRMTIASTGQVGIGKTPRTGFGINLDVSGGIQLTNDSANISYLAFGQNSNPQLSYTYIGGDARTSGFINFFTNDAERVRITQGGQLCVGATNNFGSGLLCLQGITSTYNIIAIKDTYTGAFPDNWYAYFLNDSNSRAGGIQHTASTTVSFVTSSDYRLKEDFKQINGLDTISKIKTYNFKFKEEEFRMDGVIAHELAEVLPYAVSGVKDGKEMQGVDYSKIVPVLVKAIQELSAEITILKNK